MAGTAPGLQADPETSHETEDSVQPAKDEHSEQREGDAQPQVQERMLVQGQVLHSTILLLRTNA